MKLEPSLNTNVTSASDFGRAEWDGLKDTQLPERTLFSPPIVAKLGNKVRTNDIIRAHIKSD